MKTESPRQYTINGEFTCPECRTVRRVDARVVLPPTQALRPCAMNAPNPDSANPQGSQERMVMLRRCDAAVANIQMTTEMQLCAKYHRHESNYHKSRRLFREQCNLGPPVPRELELQHARWARCIDELMRERVRRAEVVVSNEKAET